MLENASSAIGSPGDTSVVAAVRLAGSGPSNGPGGPHEEFPVGNAAAAVTLGIMALEGGDLDRAVDLLGRAADGDPLDPDAHVALGLALARRGDVALAIAVLRRAVELDPEQFLARLHLADLYLRSELAREARAQLIAAMAVARTAEERSVVRCLLTA